MLFKSMILIKIQFESRLHYIDIIAYHCINFSPPQFPPPLLSLFPFPTPHRSSLYSVHVLVSYSGEIKETQLTVKIN